MSIEWTITIGDLLTILSFVGAITAYILGQKHRKRRETIEAFNRIQEAVLDKLATVDRANAIAMVKGISNPECREAYDGYRVLLARVEHFAIGINGGIYDIKLVDKLAGTHLIFLYDKVEPIIANANMYSENNAYYREYGILVEKLRKMHPEIKCGR